MSAGCTMAGNPQDDMDNELFVSIDDTHAEAPNGISEKYLSAVWRISENEHRRMIEVKKQLKKQDHDSSLSRNFGTNGTMC